MVLLQNINMQTIGSTSKRKRKLDYVGPENQLVVSCFDTPKKIAPKQREHRVFVGGHGNTDWDRRMEGFEGIAAAKEEHEPTTDEECTPVDIDWASTDESESNSVNGQEDAPSSSREHKKNLLRMKELNADTRSLKERLSRQSTSAFRMRAVTKTGSLQHSGRIPAGCGRHREQVSRRSSRAAGEGTQWDSADMSISDYDSDTEENEEFEKPTNDEDIVKTTDSLSPVIGSLTPSMSRSPLPPDETAANRSKISDWVKCLQWQDTTPEKQSDIMEESNVADSTKKKPKYIRHGLADQLQRLVAREKSAVAFWLHKLTTARTATPATAGATTTSGATTTAAGATTTSEATTTTGAVFDSKVLSVKVLKLRKEYSLLVAECCYLRSSSEPGDNDNVVILFTNSSKVMHGSTVNIHPPWQSLDTGGRKVILCTHFHEVFPHEAPTITQHTTSSTLLATWKCPCEQDRSLDPLACPAAEFPCSTAARTGKSAAGDDVSCLSHVPASLTGIHTDQSHKLVTVSGNEMASHCSPSLSILDSVEKQGGCTTASVGFTAAVQRVFSHCNPVGGAGRLASRAVSWSLLVQDTYGAVCHIEVTDRLVERAPWIEILHSGEGRVYNFTGLRLVRRTSRARCAGLFGVIDAIWTTTAMLRHEDVSQESSVGSEPITFTEPPGFCYHLAAVWPESVCSLSHTTPRSPCLYNPLRHTPLAALDGAHGRVNLLARVFCHIHDVSSPSVDGIHSVIYVTDASWGDSGRRGERRYMCVLVKQTCCLPDGPWLTTDSGTGVVIFKDLLSHQPGRCYFDPYSRLYDTTREETLTRFSLAAADVTAVGMATFKPPPMALDVHTYDLVKLEGRITSVDESTAYSWIECDVCRSDKLAADGSSRGTVRCSQCERSVEHPIAKVNLDVFVSCSQLRDVVVKVKLLQPTIEKLLPTHKDDEGYDVESVLGNDLGPLTCVVVSVTKRKDSGHFVLQELTTRSHPI